MEEGRQREGPLHLYPFKHGQEKRDLTLGTAAQERLSTEGNILLQNLRQGGEGWTGLSKHKGKQSAWCCKGAAKLNPTNKELTLLSGDKSASTPTTETSASQPLALLELE